MDRDLFLDRLAKRDYDELEKELEKEYNLDQENYVKYQLGICYSEQYKKKVRAAKIFKELLSENFLHPFIYSFLADNAKGDLEKIKIMQEGMKQFDNELGLKIQYLMFLEDNQKIQFFNKYYDELKTNYSSCIEMICCYYRGKNFQNAIKLFENISEENIKNNVDIQFVKLLIYYMASKEIDRNMLNSFLITDENSLCGYILRLIEIDLEQDFKIVDKLINQLEYLPNFDEDFLEIHNNGWVSYFSFSGVFYNLIEKIINKISNKKGQFKLTLIKNLYNMREQDLNISQLKKIRKDIKKELETVFNKNLLNIQLDVNSRLKDNKEYIKIYFDILDLNMETEEVSLQDFDELDLDFASEILIKRMRLCINYDKYQSFFEELILNLYSKKKYKSIVKIISSIEFEKLNYLKVGFELAFSLNDNGKQALAKAIYSKYDNLNPNNHAVLNNLGVIYEEEGNLEKSLELFKKAESISHDDIYNKNLLRCVEKIKLKNEDEEKEKKALKFMVEENIWIITKLRLFYENANKDGIIVCSYKNLPSVLGCSEDKSKEVLDQMLKKGYIFKVPNQSGLAESTYKINQTIRNKLADIEKENSIIASFTDNLNNFTIDKLSSIEYVIIISKLNLINESELRDIFIRDYNELIFNYLSKQKKTVIILSGSIIELLLFYILKKNNIQKYAVGPRMKVKKITEMDITEMLEVCGKTDLIENSPEKFIEGMKQLRNFIHPGKELRFKELAIDKITIDMSFSIVNWLISKL